MSRPRSGRGASSGGSRAATQRGVYVQAPKSDIFVVLLGVALGAMVLGCILLLVVWSRYEFKTSVATLAPPPAAATAVAFTRPDGGPEKFDTVHL